MEKPQPNFFRSLEKIDAIHPLGDTIYLQNLLSLCETPQIF